MIYQFHSHVWRAILQLSYCQFWIYCVGVNRKYTIWQLYFHPPSKFNIHNMTQLFICFICQDIGPVLKINNPHTPHPHHPGSLHLSMYPYSLIIHHSLHYIWICMHCLFATEGNQSDYKWTKNGGKTLDNPNDLFARLYKKNFKVVISTLHACSIGTA